MVKYEVLGTSPTRALVPGPHVHTILQTVRRHPAPCNHPLLAIMEASMANSNQDATSPSDAGSLHTTKPSTDQYCILFYKYHPLTDDPSLLEQYRVASEELCTSLHLTGRILIGLSNNGEGINGTLAGSKADLDSYVDCMLGREDDGSDDCDENSRRRASAVSAFRAASKEFFAELNVPELVFSSSNDFKWSSWTSSQEKSSGTWFPDLNIKIVKEIISTGGAFSNITTNDTSVGYLTPKEWHKEMQDLMKKYEAKQSGSSERVGKEDEDEVETILIDVRNHKECQIGTFAPGVAIDPNTKTFAQFPKWVKDSSTSTLANKRILMYCTGGIRCEKASAYVRQMIPENKGVFHLKGGIHKYLEEFSGNSSSAFSGKNFVFDRRGALGADDCVSGNKGDANDTTLRQHDKANNRAIVGQCLYCSCPFDTFLPQHICTVCREPTLVCSTCDADLNQKQQTLRGLDGSRAEYHCEDHRQLRSCYFTSLGGFSNQVLKEQLKELQKHSKPLEGLGKKGKQRRRTLRKQMDKIEAALTAVGETNTNTSDGIVGNVDMIDTVASACRHCGSTSCSADCWGFHGGHTRMENREKSICGSTVVGNETKTTSKKRTRASSNKRPVKLLKRQNDLSEIETLRLCKAPSECRDKSTNLRVPPPVVRVLRSAVKGRWCGKPLSTVLSSEFHEFSLSADGDTREKEEWMQQLIDARLIKVNGVPVSKSDGLLQKEDTVERVVHWHEPPIIVPETISLTKHSLPDTANCGNGILYCINKPASVPVYPSGPYYSNSLLMMVEAQEGLPPKSLVPCHRIDRATSGVLLCTIDSKVSRAVQGRMASRNEVGTQHPIKKLYLARVQGKFPDPSSSVPVSDDMAGISDFRWSGDTLEVSAPIAAQLSDATENGNVRGAASMMHRSVSRDGKQAISRFRLLSYDAATDQSLVSCCPITGRGHQLRVHLQFIGLPIHNDVEYGGVINTKKMQEQKDASIKSMLDVSKATSVCLRDKSLSEEEVETAIRLCKCCCNGKEGVKEAFNTAQLLGGGHEVDLHALRYSISFDDVTVECATDLPPWVTSFEDVTLNRIAWLT